MNTQLLMAIVLAIEFLERGHLVKICVSKIPPANYVTSRADVYWPLLRRHTFPFV
jgi:hypothetical protein